jgi:lysine-specific histone demethylase 1
VQQPVAAHTTRWASEEFSRGSYSFVAVGCSGDDYDALALPVARRLLFAGEHTCKEHPDTVGGEAGRGSCSCTNYRARCIAKGQE